MFVEVNRVTLYYEVFGEGTPLIMVHGNGETHEIFNEAAQVLKNNYQVYLIDSRGHGKSSKGSEIHYEDMAEDIRSIVETLELEQPIFYGFSDGGIIGLLLASKYPKLLSTLIISGANIYPKGMKRRWYYLFSCIFKITKDRLVGLMLKEPNISKEELSCISIPTYVLAGSHDMVRRKHTMEIVNAISTSKCKIVKRAGHGSYIVHKEKIAQLMLEYLEKLS